MVVAEEGNVFHHVKRNGKLSREDCRGGICQGETSGSRSRKSGRGFAVLDSTDLWFRHYWRFFAATRCCATLTPVVRISFIPQLPASVLQQLCIILPTLIGRFNGQ